MHLNIGFDAKRAVQNHTGLGNYSRYVVEILSEHYPEALYTLFCPKKKPNPRLSALLSRQNVAFVFPSGFFGKLLPAFWRVLWIKRDMKREGINLFHGLSNELPFGIRAAGIRTVVTVHDLIFLRYPQYYKPVDRLIYRLKFRYACRKADAIIAVSECTARDIASFFHVPAKKIRVIYQGCHPDFEQDVASDTLKAVAEKYRLPSRFVLSVGSIEARKNLLLAVRALKELPEDIHLVAVGKRTAYQSEVEAEAQAAGLTSRLHLLNDLPFEDLPAVYRLASVFVYPSYFEGFGIPVIEALTSGVPVVAATGSCLEEAGGPDSIYVDPDDSRALAEKITAILTDETLSQQMIAAGRQYVARFSEQRIAAEIMAVYRSLVSR
jgi:glycosyltransferase involved in cell wall biosynthesis